MSARLELIAVISLVCPSIRSATNDETAQSHRLTPIRLGVSPSRRDSCLVASQCLQLTGRSAQRSLSGIVTRLSGQR